MQDALKFPVFGYDQQWLAGASCRIQTFADHLMPMMIGGIRLGCPPSSHRIPPLGRIVLQGLIKSTPHSGSHADAKEERSLGWSPPRRTAAGTELSHH